MSSRSDWEREAQRWLAWARAPGHDAYWTYAPAFFEHIVPPPGGRTLEIGCGEGRVARDLAARGHRVVAVDASPTLLRAARDADPAGRYVLADAAALPLEDASVDLVVAYNSLMDVDDLPRAVAEAARVLADGGRLCVCVTHPFRDAGEFADDEPNAPFVVAGPYLGRHRVDVTMERDGFEVTFRGWRYPLEAYARAVEDAGFVIDRLREPVPEAPAGATPPTQWHHDGVPMFLHLRALRRPRHSG